MGYHRTVIDEVAPHTCPLINQVKSTIEKVYDLALGVQRCSEGVDPYDFADDILSALEGEAATLEEVRIHNAALREALVEALRVKDQLQYERDDYERKLEAMEKERDELQEAVEAKTGRIENLEAELEEAQEKADDLAGEIRRWEDGTYTTH